jgi:hypothetical protein
MIAYNHTGLDNIDIQGEAREALTAGCITEEVNALIRQRHPIPFYAPNIYIRIGLFILTVIIILFSLGILALMRIEGDDSFAVLLIVVGLICLGVLEWLVYSKKHHQSGVDDALLWAGTSLLAMKIIFFAEPITFIVQCYLIGFLALYGALRYIDRIMTLVVYGALLCIVFKTGTAAGAIGKAILPFVVMGMGVFLYLSAKMLSVNERYRLYRPCLVIIEFASLFVFYAAGNYYVVRELNALISDPPMSPGVGIPLGWLFWLFTVVVPLWYVYRGLMKKDRIFLWTGLLLIAAMIFTIRHYYHLLPVELMMTIGGILLISAVYACIKYLRTPRQGFTYEETNDRGLLENLHLESLVIAESFAPVTPAPGSDLLFGGGSGGGGGAGGQY